MRYRDFELKLSGRMPTDYFVEMLASPVGRRSEPVPLCLPTKMLADWESSLRRGQFDRALARTLGIELFNALFPPVLRSMFDESRGLNKDEKILRLRLDIRAPELAIIPWEVIHDGRSHLALERRYAILRYLRDHPAIYPVEGIHSPGILLAVSTPVDVLALPSIEREIQAISRSVEPLIASEKVGRLDILRRTTLQKLQRQLRRHSYHVLHYMGHGMFSHNQGFLALEDERGHARWIDAETLGCFFQDKSLRLLFLNACQTATASQKNEVLGVAQAALAAGVPAVVAMQAAINDELAAAFAHEFYLSLMEGHPLEACMAEGRKAMVAHATLDRFDWTIPVLFSNAQDGLVWKLPETKEEIEKNSDAPADAGTVGKKIIHIDKSTVNGWVVQANGDANTIGETVNQTIYYEPSPKDGNRKADK